MKNQAKLFLAGSLALFTAWTFSAKAQQGKDGVGNITTANSIVNTYARLTANASAGNTSITVNSSAGIAVGDLVFIIQMYGADVNAITDPNNVNNSTPNDTSYGKIKNYNNAGLNEFAQVNAVPNGTSLTLDCGLKNNYTSAKMVQVIRVPRYTSLTLTSPGTITCPAWNGTTGGVVVIEVQGNTVINTGATIDVSGKGFRGGVVKQTTGYGATNVGSWWPVNGGIKGESIVGDSTVYHNTFSGSLCKGNVANGGGGGDAMNCGGGGGSNGGVIASWNGMGNPDNSQANYVTAWSLEPVGPVNGTLRPTSSSGGGRGGYAFSNNNSATADPTVTGPNNAGVWGGDGRHNDGGWGGVPLDYSGGRMFMGGGGGAGDSNDGYGSGGATGGGIVYLMNYGTVSGAGQILANGNTASNTNNASPPIGNCAGIDGAGGGGGGGAVFINSVGAISLTNATPVSATGGKGGSYAAACSFATTTQNFGPGGGGGGGYVGTSSAVTSNVAGGANGIVVSNSVNGTRIATKFPPNGATSGGAGGTGTVTNFYLTASNYTVCAGTAATLSVTIGGTAPGGITVNWYNVNAGGSVIGTGNPFTTGALAVGTYTYYAGTCPGTYRAPVVVTVLNAPTVTTTATPATICSGQTSTLSASGASSYTWSANAGSVTTATAAVSPTSTAVYTVTGANGTCSVTSTVTVTVNTVPTLTTVASPTAVCAGSTATLTASGASTYTWSANAGSATTASVAVTPTVNTTYTVTGANGTCTSSQTVSVAITSAPTLTTVASPTTVCAGSTATLTASGATTYTWSANAGSATTAAVAVTPTVNTTYTVTGANGTCASSKTVAVTVASAPTLTTVASPTAICAGSTATLTASGATTYTWSANAGSATTAAVAVTPTVNTTYTVTGANGTCTSSKTVAVTVTSAPTLTTVASPTAICAGSTATLTASGATTYTWSANAGSATTSSVAVTPTVNTTYTVTGANGTCTATKTVAVTITSAPTLTITANPSSICSGQSATLTANGASTYTWSANASSATTSTVVVSPGATDTYTVTGATGSCVSTQTISVAVGSVPSLTITATPTVVCSGQSSILTASGATSYTWSANAGSALSSTTTVAPTANTTYTVTGGSAGCTGTQTISVAVTSPPSLTVTAAPSTICSGQSTTLTASGASSYTWSANAGSVTTNTAGVSPASGTTYTVSFTSGACAGSQTVSVNVNTTPSITITATPASICNGQSSTLNATGASSYTWSANAGSVNTASAVVSPTVNTTYTVTGDNGTCSSTQAIAVTVNNGPTAADSAFSGAACGQSNGTYTLNSVTGGSPSYQINFNNTGFTAITAFPYAVTGLGAGIYPVVIQDNNGCAYSTSVTINNIGGITKVDSASVAAQCNPANSGIIVLNGITGGTAPYSVSVNGASFATIASFPDSLKNLNAGTYTVVVQDNAGCLHTSLISVGSANGITQVSNSTMNAKCNPAASGIIVLTSVTGGTSPYQVSVNGGVFSPVASFPDSLKNLLTGSYTVTVKDTAGCTNSSVINVASETGPTAASSATTNDTCGRNVGTLTVSGVTGGTANFTYSLNGATPQSSATFTGLSQNIYTVSIIDANGCSLNIVDTVGLVGPPAPVIVAGGPTTFCQGGSVVLSSSSATGNTWSNSATTQTISVSSSGIYSVSVSASGCTAPSNTIQVVVNPNPNITVNSASVCSGSSATITASGANTFTWSPASGLSATSGSSVTATPSTTSNYTVSGTDANNCTSSSPFTVTVTASPLAPVVNPDTLYYCLYQAADSLKAVGDTAATFTWYDANMNPLSSAPVPATNILGVTIWQVSQQVGACTSTTTPVWVMVVPRPSAVFSTNPSTGYIMTGQSVSFAPNQQYSNFFYSWNFGDPISGAGNASLLMTPSHTYMQEGTYCPNLYVISNQTGCRDSSTICIEVINGFVTTIPNIFSPNGDHLNDVFSIKTEGMKELSCDLYDRWGVKMYGWTGLTGSWDGTNQGKACVDGTYFYIVTTTDLRGNTDTKSGYVQLVR